MHDTMENLHGKRNGESGFTLIELLVVIVILGILAAVAVFAVGGITDRGAETACDATANTVRVASEAYLAQTGGYAATLDLLEPEYVRLDDTGWTTGNTITVDGGVITYASTGSVTDNCA